MTTMEGGITFNSAVRPISSGNQTYLLLQSTMEGGWNQQRALMLIAAKQARLGALTDGWRGPDSLAPCPIALIFYAETIRAIRNLSPRFLLDAEPTPTSDGGIQLEWERGTVGYSAEITADGQLILNVFADDPAHDVEHTIEQPSPMQLANFIAFGTHKETHALGF